jgi:NAD(P)-dependent dehydrogenase (short-subunit alcohol dehydrogenase family)
VAHYELHDRVAIVTGASAGLGVEMARALAGSGAHVVLAARREQRLRALAAELESSHGVRALPVRADVTSEEDWSRLVGTAVDELGRLDILVNNAGSTFMRPLVEHTLDDWHRIVDANLTSTFLGCREAARVMVPQESGSIVNVSSVFAFTAIPHFPIVGYYASKGGVTALTKALAVELGKANVRVNEIAPTFFPSEMSEGMFADHDEAERLRQEVLWPRTALPHLARPEWVRGAVCFLASDDACYVTGQTLAVDGGWLAL